MAGASRRRERVDVLCEGRHLRLLKRGKWEYVERHGRAQGVMIVAVTPDGRLLLVEEYREPARARVLSLPAGLVGDEGHPEPARVAARRELREETGYSARVLRLLGGGPVSPGLASERVTFFLARGLRRLGDPTGEEEITVRAVPLGRVREFARRRARAGLQIHPLLWAGLYLASL